MADLEVQEKDGKIYCPLSNYGMLELIIISTTQKKVFFTEVIQNRR